VFSRVAAIEFSRVLQCAVDEAVSISSRERRLNSHLNNSTVARATRILIASDPCAKAHGYSQVAADAAEWFTFASTPAQHLDYAGANVGEFRCHLFGRKSGIDFAGYAF